MRVRRLRLVTGLILAAYVIPHLINHAFGLWSLEAMEALRRTLSGFWRTPPMTVALYGAFLVHFLLALLALYRRKTLRMPLWEAFQIGLGLAIMPLLFVHVVGTRLSFELLQVKSTYEYVIGALWNLPGFTLKQTALLLVVWGHLVVGLHYWLRLGGGYRRTLPLWQTLAALLPTLALLGFYRIGAEIGDVDIIAKLREVRAAKPVQFGRLASIQDALPWVFWLSLGAVLCARLARDLYRRRHGTVRIEHPTAGMVSAPVGQTLLEALRGAAVPHSSVCGGRARCTTCRVRVRDGLERVAPPAPIERRALDGINAGPGVRLACQLRLTGDLAIVPLIPPGSGLHHVRKPGGVEGQEQQVAVMFIDLRGSTALGEQRLPYDVVFILNQFFAEMAAALRETGGHYAQFTGDGLMALYGIERGLERGCRDALAGAHAMLQRLRKLNERLAHELPAPLRMGIGIHSGEAIVGTMGPPASPILSAIGDNINIAARLESATKLFDCPLVVSRVTLERARLDLSGHTVHQVEVRGRRDKLEVLAISDLDGLLAGVLGRAID